MTDDKYEPVTVDGWKYRTAVAVALLPGLVALVVAIAEIISDDSFLASGSIFMLFFVYWITSIRPVKTNYRAGITVLEQPAREVGPGYYFVPRFLCDMQMMPMTVIQEQFPADPEKVSKRDDDLGLLPGEFRPIRAMTRGPNDADGNDPLNARLTLEVTFTVMWHIEKGDFFDLFVKIPGDTWDEKVVAIRHRMRDTGEAQLLQEIAKLSASEVNGKLEEIGHILETEIQKKVEGWGIHIDSADIQAPDYPHKVNDELANIVTSRARLQSTANDAEAERNRLAKIGEGEAAQVISMAEAKKRAHILEGEGIKAAAESIGMAGEDYYAGQIAKETIGEGDVILGVEGIAQAVGLGKHIFGNRKGSG